MGLKTDSTARSTPQPGASGVEDAIDLSTTYSQRSSLERLALEQLTRVVRISSNEFLGVLPGVNQIRTEAFHLIEHVCATSQQGSDASISPLIQATDLVRNLFRACDAGGTIRYSRGAEGQAMIARMLDPAPIDTSEMRAIITSLTDNLVSVAAGCRGWASVEAGLGSFGVLLPREASMAEQTTARDRLLYSADSLGMGRLFQIFSDRPFRNDAFYLFAKLTPEQEISISVVEIWSLATSTRPITDSFARAFPPDAMCDHLHDDDRIDCSYPMVSQLSLDYAAIPRKGAGDKLAAMIAHVVSNPRSFDKAGGYDHIGSMRDEWSSLFNCSRTCGNF